MEGIETREQCEGEELKIRIGYTDYKIYNQHFSEVQFEFLKKQIKDNFDNPFLLNVYSKVNDVVTYKDKNFYHFTRFILTEFKDVRVERHDTHFFLVVLECGKGYSDPRLEKPVEPKIRNALTYKSVKLDEILNIINGYTQIFLSKKFNGE